MFRWGTSPWSPTSLPSGQAVSAPSHPGGARPGQGWRYGPGAAGAAPVQNPPNPAGHHLTSADPGQHHQGSWSGRGLSIGGGGASYWPDWDRRWGVERSPSPFPASWYDVTPPPTRPLTLTSCWGRDRQTDRQTWNSLVHGGPPTEWPRGHITTSSYTPLSLNRPFLSEFLEVLGFLFLSCLLHNTQGSQTGIISTRWRSLYIYAMYTEYRQWGDKSIWQPLISPVVPLEKLREVLATVERLQSDRLRVWTS